MRIGITGSSYVQQLGLHDPMATGALAAPATVGPANAYADRTYDNGYVKKDPGTGNPASLDPNTTWNWGFNNPSQYNAAAQTLTFQATGAKGYSVLQNDPTGGAGDSMLGIGFQLTAGFTLSTSGPWTFDLCLGFQGLFSDHSSIHTTTYREAVGQITVTDTYNTTGVPAANILPGGQPFHGTYLGPFDTPPVVPSPVIPNIPASRATASAALSSSYNDIAFDIDQNLYQISLGPQIGYAPNHWLKLRARPTASINIIDAEVQRTEQFIQTPAGGASTVLNQWYNHAGQREVYFGLGATVGADAELGKGFYAGIYGGYEWVAEQVNVVVGPNTVTLDASGWVVGATVGKRF